MAATMAGPGGSGVTTLFTALIVLAWYGSNIGTLLLNKYLLSSTGFDHPVFLTLCHMVACVSIGLFMSLSRLVPAKQVKTRRQFGKIVVLAALFCLTIVSGNASLKYIPVSFNQAVGSTTPFFTAALAYVMQGTRESNGTYLSLAPIAIGVMIASGGEPLFNALGVALCLLATAMRALKSVVQSILMSDPSEKLDAMSLLLYMSAASIGFLIPMALALEPGAYAQAISLITADTSFSWWLLANSCLAYAVNLTNFLVTKYTSALTLQVLGNAKGVVAAVVSVLVFSNPVTWAGCIGYAITMMGVVLYSESKRRGKSAAAKAAAIAAEEREPLIAAENGEGDASRTRSSKTLD